MQPSNSDLTQKTFVGKIWLLFWVGLLLYLLLQLIVKGSHDFAQGLDFKMRYNEAECVRSGRDPYLVWNGTIKTEEYTPWDFKYLMESDGMNLIHAYPPWEYTWVLPFTCFSHGTAEIVFRCLSCCCIVFIIGSAFFLGYKARHEVWSGFAVAASVLIVVPSMRSCLHFLNYGVLIASAVLVALLCHRKHRDWLAGLFWAFTLVKPHIGGLFFIALLVRWKWRSLLSAGMLTLLATLVSAAFCRRSPVEMVMSISSYSQGQFSGTGFFPSGVLSSVCGESTLIIGSALIGVSLCLALSWMLRSCENVFEWVMPPVILSTLWSVCRSHDIVINAILLLGLALSAVKGKNMRSVVLDMALLLLISSRGLDDALPIRITQIMAIILLFVRAVMLRSEKKGIANEALNCNTNL